MNTRLALLSIAALIIAITGPFQAHAYTFDDAFNDRIGNRYFELYGMNVTQTSDQIIFDIFTNYKETGCIVGSWDTRPGDFAIDLNGDSVYEYGIAFTTHDSSVKGGVYQIDTSLNQTGHIVNGWYISNNYAPPGYSYNKNREVMIAGGAKIDDIEVMWNSAGTSPDWRINFAIDKDALSLMHGDTFNFFYSVATCSNDNMRGTVTVTPEPASLSLLALGLAGLARLRKRSRK